MVYTRSDAKASFNHILDNVLGQGDGTPLKLSLAEEEIEDVFALYNLTDTDIDSLKYKTKDANVNVVLSPIRLADQKLLRAFLHSSSIPNWKAPQLLERHGMQLLRKHLILSESTQSTWSSLLLNSP
jgi:hypothetical protein